MTCTQILTDNELADDNITKVNELIIDTTYAYRPVFASNPPSDVIQALVQPLKVFRVSKSATFARV
jgi:hypothetical protein